MARVFKEFKLWLDQEDGGTPDCVFVGTEATKKETGAGERGLVKMTLSEVIELRGMLKQKYGSHRSSFEDRREAQADLEIIREAMDAYDVWFTAHMAAKGLDSEPDVGLG